MLQNKKIAFVGSGNMAEALIRGLLPPAGPVVPENISAADISEKRLSDMHNRYSIHTYTDNTEAIKLADIVILAVKPQVIRTVLPEISEHANENKLVISIAAGVKMELIQDSLKQARVIRVMPNVAALVHAAISAISRGKYATEDDVQVAQKIFNAVGDTVIVEEKLMDAVTGLSGSGPGYIFHVINALTDGGVKVGLPRDTALKLAAHTVYGAAKMLIETGEHPMKLRDMVTSPGGTTIAGIHALERNGLGAAFMDAIEVATRRSQELGSK